MKKLFWFLVSFAFFASLGLLLKNSLDTAKYFQAEGREATLKVGKKYNTSVWYAPLPIKKLHTYTAVLLPNHEVLVESDQELRAGTEYFIRFATRDVAETVRAFSRVPLVNTLRLKSEADGTPVRIADTDLMDRAIDKAMGPPAEGVHVTHRPGAEAAPDRAKPTVPFLFTGSKDPAPEVLWNNSTVGEIAVIAWAFLGLFFFLQALSVPFSSHRKAGSEQKDFVHPSQLRIEPDAPEAASVRLKYQPKRAETHSDGATPLTPEPPAAPPPPKPASIPMPPGIKITPRVTKPEDDSCATTAPFVPPAGSSGTSLKLKRRPPVDTPPPPSAPPARD